VNFLERVAAALERIANAQINTAWTHADYISVVNVVVLFLTLIALVCYTVETSKLRKATEEQTKKSGLLLDAAKEQNETAQNLLTQAQRQNELAIMPMLTLYRDLTGKAEEIVLRNVGSGPAFNVRIEVIPSKATPPDGEHEITLDLPNNVVAPQDRYTLRLLAMQPNGRGPNFGTNALSQWITAGYLPNPLEINVHCVSLDSKPHRFVFKFANDLGTPKISFERHLSANEEPGGTDETVPKSSL
jgi:hypothetical protein